MTTRSTNRIAIYSRYSSDLQNDKSIEDQIAVCEKFAAKQGWKVVGNFYDRAASGASIFGRPQFAKMVSESGSCDNGTRYYIEKIEQLVLSRLKAQIDNPKQMGKFVDAYLAERRALSANARRDKAKITAQIAGCQKAIDNLVLAVEKGSSEWRKLLLGWSLSAPRRPG